MTRATETDRLFDNLNIITTSATVVKGDGGEL